MSILVVDDSRSILAFVKHFLQLAGYQDIFTASSGEEALAFLRTNAKTIDLILMDVMMPGMSGPETCQVIKKDPSIPDIPVMIMTADTSESRLEESYQAGAVDYILKPIRKIELLARVNSAITLKQEMDKVKAHERELLELKHELELANRELSRLVTLDGLTGIPNRRAFDEILKKEWQRSYRESTCLGLLMVDIDCFKQYNDTYGHQAGDDTLKNVANDLNQSLHRPADFVARYGGEEFALIIPKTNIKSTKFVGECVRRNIEDLKIPHTESSVHNVITVSVGAAAIFPRECGSTSWNELIKKADQALYEAKKTGRNRVVVSKK